MELALRIVGVSHIVLAVAHIPIARRLGWRRDLAMASSLTRQVFWSHTFFLCVVLILMGLLAATAPMTLLTPSALGRKVTLGLTIFWSLRLLGQWLFFEWAHWRGKRFETYIHALFTATWIVYIVVYASALRLQCAS